ncbi:DNA polymerase III subunit gamma/tau [Alkalimarinus coralli]|uniref:DNA polymerase III subunit gamma/tau n=1 Tax=Alkalimarinus coralli TaxID=2935863 RepID=UPI00202B7A65|nr:DNA polymerase III subunit gamma/tau [Alkalimarinus coralli]
MSYQVLARKWRPQSFKEMVGQEHVLKALIHSLDQKRLHHAYLFTGTRGVGKTTIGRILAKCLNCETEITSVPCGQCDACREITEGRFVDLIEIDAASRTKVEDMRELLDNVQYAPTRGRFKVYLIDEVHMLSQSSFNALLKTLEEPPEHVKFLFATTDPQKLPVTILSRCLQFNLKNMPPERIVGHLKNVLGQEQIAFEESALWLLARSADGSMRDALSLTDQAIAYGNHKLAEREVSAMLGSIDQKQVYRIIEAVANLNAEKVLDEVASLAEYSPDYSAVLANVISVLHRVAIEQAVPGSTDNSMGDQQQIVDLASALSAEDVQLFYQVALVGRSDLPISPDQRAGLEMVLLRMLAFQPNVDKNTPKLQLTSSDGNNEAQAVVSQVATQPQAAGPRGEAIVNAEETIANAEETIANAEETTANAEQPVGDSDNAKEQTASDAVSAAEGLAETSSPATAAINAQAASPSETEQAAGTESAPPWDTHSPDYISSEAVAPATGFTEASSSNGGVSSPAEVTASQSFGAHSDAPPEGLPAHNGGQGNVDSYDEQYLRAQSNDEQSGSGTPGSTEDNPLTDSTQKKTADPTLAADADAQQGRREQKPDLAPQTNVTEPGAGRSVADLQSGTIDNNSNVETDNSAEIPKAPAPVSSTQEVLPESAGIDDFLSIDNPWPHILPLLKLTGMTQNLAANTGLKLEHDRAELCAAEGNYKLLTDTHKSRIIAAFKRLFGDSFQVDFSLGRTEVETPAEWKERKREERLALAVSSIEQDPNVVTLVNKFDATILTTTVEPID